VADVGMAAVGSSVSLYAERSAGSRRGSLPAGADMDEAMCGRWAALCWEALTLCSWAPGRDPMLMFVAGDWACLRERRDGDGDSSGDDGRGAGDDDMETEASGGGSSLTVVCVAGCGYWAVADT
jgi:hypothetical protein